MKVTLPASSVFSKADAINEVYHPADIQSENVRTFALFSRLAKPVLASHSANGGRQR